MFSFNQSPYLSLLLFSCKVFLYAGFDPTVVVAYLHLAESNGINQLNGSHILFRGVGQD